MSRAELPAENDESTDVLFDRVLHGVGTDAGSRALVALHGRPTRRVIDRCVALCGSPDALERTVGLRVLRELGHQLVEPGAVSEVIEPLVIELANTDADADVVSWAIACLGYRSRSPEAIASVVAHANHVDATVRHAVAAFLPGMLDPTALDGPPFTALTELTDDPDVEVRAYALMGLTIDLGLVEEVRPILESHLADPDEGIRRHVREVLDPGRA